MKCRKVVKSSDGHYDIVWFGRTSKYTETKKDLTKRGVEKPYAILFKLKLEDDIKETESNNNIITNKPGNLSDDVEILQIDMLNKRLEYNSTKKIKLYACYYAEKVYKRNLIPVVKEYNLIDGENQILNFEIINLTNEWNDGLSYAEKQEGLASSLIQRLNVLKGELWYKINYGLPLFEKIKDKDVMDSVIVNIILTHPDVASIKTLQSSIEKNTYCINKLEIISIFNEEILLY